MVLKEVPNLSVQEAIVLLEHFKQHLISTRGSSSQRKLLPFEWPQTEGQRMEHQFRLFLVKTIVSSEPPNSEKVKKALNEIGLREKLIAMIADWADEYISYVNVLTISTRLKANAGERSKHTGKMKNNRYILFSQSCFCPPNLMIVL